MSIWRDNLRPASFRGVEFKVSAGSRSSGRRGIEFEYPKRDDPYFEDLGRMARRWAVTGYVLGSNYQRQADALCQALEAIDPGTLVHPTMGTMRVVCQPYTRTEKKTEGGYAEFDMIFVEAGSNLLSRLTENTQGIANDMAERLTSSVASLLNSSLK
jgi:prophage DNA circulation protein